MYDVLKYLHIIVAIAWLGGSFGMVLLGALAARADNHASLIAFGRNTETLAKAVFMPSSVVILVLGAVLVWLQWGFAEAWVVIGIIGIVITGGIGGTILTPMTKELGELESGPEAAALAAKLLRSARGDLAILAVIVWDMVSKPAWSDVTEIAAMAAVALLAAALFIRR